MVTFNLDTIRKSDAFKKETERIAQAKRFGTFDPQKELDQARNRLLEIQANLGGGNLQSGGAPDPAVDQSGNLDSGFNFTFGDDRGIDKTIDDLLREAGKSKDRKISERDIRRETLARFQDEIDATNLIFDDLVSDARERGQSRQGSARALSFAQGLGGSARGAAQQENVRQLGREEVAAINAERSARIGAIMGQVRSSTLKRLEEERLAKQQGAASYLELIKLQDERTDGSVNEVVAALIDQGIDFDELAPTEVEELTKNLKVNAERIQRAYLDATADTRAAEQASSREAAIVSVIGQGVRDPSEIFNLINFDEEGNRIGDISTSEIKAVVDDLKTDDKDNTFTLTQGQKKFRVNPDGTVSEIAFNPKTFAPKSGSDDTFGELPDVLSFDEWKETEVAKEILGEEQQTQGQSFAPEKADEVLRPFYDQAVSEVQSKQSLGKLTNTDKGTLQQAGLDTAPPQAQSFFLNTPNKFREYYTQQIALGNVERNADVQEVNELFVLWEQQQEEEKGDDLEALLSQLRGG